MLLKIFIEDNQFAIDIPEGLIQAGESFFEKMDHDMAKGWQMNREWVENPNNLQRCQIAADRLADAIAGDNETLANLTAAYILVNMPEVKEVHIDTEGEMQETRFV